MKSAAKSLRNENMNEEKNHLLTVRELMIWSKEKNVSIVYFYERV